MAIYQFHPFSFAPTALITLNCNTCHIRYISFIPLVVMELLSLSGITPGTLHRDLTQIFLDETESFRTHQRVASGHHRIPPGTAASYKKAT